MSEAPAFLRRDLPFAGFQPGARATVIPSAFFTEVLPGIDDEAELRVTLYLLYVLGRHKGHPRYVSRNELAALAPLAESLAPLPGEIAENLTRGLDFAARRQAFLALDVARDGRPDTLFFLNTPGDRRALEKVRDGLLPIAGAAVEPAEPPAPVRENVFQLYEANIGPITPLVAEELREAEQLYPFDWIEEAMKEAAVLNKRSWRYAARILERWAMEGRQGEKVGRDSGHDDTIRARVINRFDNLSRDR
ncbi:MAG TPA: DnaD domain protein [Dehalococcoidia bacterium]